jgi:hypothetical protein
MQANFTLKLNHMLKKTIISSTLIGVVALAIASSGGGIKKRSESPMRPEFEPIRTTKGFTLRAGATYMGSHILNVSHTCSVITYNTLITYEKGNTVYILPHQAKINTMPYTPNVKTNLNFVGVKLSLHK